MFLKWPLFSGIIFYLSNIDIMRKFALAFTMVLLFIPFYLISEFITSKPYGYLILPVFLVRIIEEGVNLELEE